MVSDSLDHQKYAYTGSVTEVLDMHCNRLDQAHPLERKIKFLLDVRGYIKVNNIVGSYVEFGSYKSEMQYCAFKVLEKTGCVTRYVGMDTFEGEPSMSDVESASMPFVSEGSFESTFEDVRDFVSENIGQKGVLIKGDFRQKNVIKECLKHAPISLAVVDCNLASSIETSFNFVAENIIPGGVIFVDDYYTNFGSGNAVVHDLLTEAIKSKGLKLIQHGFYPPFAKSYIICK